MTSQTSIPAIDDSAITSETEVSPVSIPTDITFNRENIEKYLHNKVRLVNSQDGLDQFCYTSCDKNEPEIVKECRGVIFNKNELVSKCFSYTTEFTENDNDEIVSLNLDFNNCKFYTAYEGCTVKVFFYNGSWHISTNRKLNGFLSKWASKTSFGDFFLEALTYQFENNKRLKENHPFEKGVNDPIEVFSRCVLDKSKQYVFLLLNNSENRIVCNSPENPTIFHIGTFTNNNGEFTLSMDDDIYIPYPESHSFTKMKDIYDFVYSSNYMNIQGIIIFAPNNKQYKILNIDYKDLYNVRGNEPSIPYRYLQVRMDSDKKEMINFLYPSSIPIFDEYENHLYDTAKFIYTSYVDRFINKKTVTIPKEEYHIMSQAHTWYQSDRDHNRISIDKIIEIINIQKPTHLNAIIRKIKLENKKKLQEKKEDKQHKRLLP